MIGERILLGIQIFKKSLTISFVWGEFGQVHWSYVGGIIMQSETDVNQLVFAMTFHDLEEID